MVMEEFIKFQLIEMEEDKENGKRYGNDYAGERKNIL